MSKTADTFPIAEFNTPRLGVRHLGVSMRTDDDQRRIAAALVPVLSPRVLAHLPPSFQVAQSAAAIYEWIAARAEESDVLVVSDKDTQNLVGLLILLTDPNGGHETVMHIGYLLAETAWGRGYASELIAGLVEAVTPLAPLTLCGGVAQENPASARVLTKLGFAQDAALSAEGTDVYTLSLPNA